MESAPYTYTKLTFRSERPTTVCRVDEVHFPANPRGTAGFFADNFETVVHPGRCSQDTILLKFNFIRLCNAPGLCPFAMDLQGHPPSLEEEEISSSPARLNADSTDVPVKSVNTWQEFFKSSSSQHHGFVESTEKAMLLLKKYELETTTKFSCYKSDKMFVSGGKTFLASKSFIYTQDHATGPIENPCHLFPVPSRTST